MFRLNTFGCLVCESDGAAVPAAVNQRRRLALLVLLADAGARGVDRERLVAFLWPEGRSESGRHAIDQLVYASRQQLGKSAVISQGGRLTLDRSIVWSDFTAFEAHLENGEREAAVALYAGPFLDGVHLADSVELERWVATKRAELEGRFLAALEKLAADARRRGDAQLSADWWRRRATAEPFGARGALGLLDALATAGDVAGAVRYARTYTALMREELGLEPDRSFSALAERLAAGTEPREPLDSPLALARRGAEAAPAADDSVASTATAPTVDRPVRAARFGRSWLRAAVAGAVMVAVTTTMVLARGRSPATTVADAASVAVLPFEDLSADRSAEYIGHGMAEDLIHALAQLPGLHVSARTSAFSARKEQTQIKQIALDLGVATVVEGSVRREGSRLRVTAQLIDAATGYHIWSGRYDGNSSDVLAAQDGIARSIAHALRPKLTTDSRFAEPRPRPSPRAYHLRLRGHFAAHQGTDAALRQAIGFFEQAIAADPAYAAAYVGLANAFISLADNGFAPANPMYEKGVAAVSTALRLDSTSAEAHTSLGHLRFHQWDWTGAERQYRRALELNPGYSTAYEHLATPLVMQGRFDEGLAMMRKAQELDPLSLAIHSSMGFLLRLARRNDEAIGQLRAVIAMDSMQGRANVQLGLSLLQNGRADEGAVFLRRALELGEGYRYTVLPMLGYAYAKAGRVDEAQEIRRAVHNGLARDSISLYFAAAFFSSLGETDEAIRLLRKALAEDRHCLVDLAVDPLMDGLRSDSRFQAVLTALGLDPAVAPPPDIAAVLPRSKSTLRRQPRFPSSAEISSPSADSRRTRAVRATHTVRVAAPLTNASTTMAAVTIFAPGMSWFSLIPRGFVHAPHAQISPPLATNASMSSFSG